MLTQRREDTGQSWLTWLQHMPQAAKPAAMLGLIERLEHVRGIGTAPSRGHLVHSARSATAPTRTSSTAPPASTCSSRQRVRADGADRHRHVISATGSYDMAFVIAGALLVVGAGSTLLLTRRPIGERPPLSMPVGA